MSNIRPISDLRNNFSEISRLVNEGSEPVILTKNGYANMVVMSATAYEEKQFESEIYSKLKAAEYESATSPIRHSHEDVITRLKAIVEGK